MSVQTDIEAARKALDPVEREARLKDSLRKAKSAAHTERNLRAMDQAELVELRKEVEDLRRRNGVLADTLAIQPPPARSKKQVEDARAAMIRAEQSKTLAQAARDEARARMEAAEKARSDAEQDAKHTEKHAEKRVREAEKVRDEALAKADKAGAKGFQRGVQAMEKAYVHAVLQEASHREHGAGFRGPERGRREGRDV